MQDITKFLKQLEGYSPTPYKDENNFTTIGYGANLDAPTTKQTMSRIGLDEVRDQADAEKLMQAQLEEKQAELKNKFKQYDSLPKGQQDALLSLQYNNPALIGPSLQRHLASGDTEEAARQILLKSNKKQSPGLAKRRLEEAALFNDGKLPPISDEEKQKIRAQLEKIKNPNTRESTLQRLDELTSTSEKSEDLGIPMIPVSSTPASMTTPPEAKIKPTMTNMRDVADQQLRQMRARDEAKAATANDAQRQKGLNAIPFDPAINAYPNNPEVDQSLLSQVQQLGMPQSFEPAPMAFPLPSEMTNEQIAAQPLDPAGVDENVELNADTEALMSEPDAMFDLPEVTGNDFLARFKQAQEARRKDQMLDAVLRASTQIGTAISGQGRIKANYDAIDAFKPLIGSELEDLKAEEGARRENDQFDSGSEMSGMTRANIATQLRKIGANKLADQVTNKNMSFDQLTKVFGSANLQNMVTQYDTAQNRLLLAKQDENAKKEKAANKLEDRQFDQEKTLRKEIADANKITGITTLDSNYKNLKKSFDEGKYNGLSDVLSIYAMIKAVDPGSVVREAEVALVLGAESPLRRLANLPAKITRGQLASPEFRAQILEAMAQLRNARAAEFNSIIGPTLRTAQRYGLDTKNILSDSLGELPTSQTSSSLPPPKVDMNALEAELKRRKGK